MRDTRDKILVWLPSPMGDAVLCTPALRAIRQHYESSQIFFLANPAVREVLSPASFNDTWIEQVRSNPFVIAKMLREHKFTCAILFKNSFASALAVFLAAVPLRIGYAREGRGFLLTDKLYPPKLPDGRFKPVSMIDYYLAIASWLGCDSVNSDLELPTDSQQDQSMRAKLPEVVKSTGPVVVIVPGGAFGPSKCWPSDRFAQTADWLISSYNAAVIVSVSPNSAEKQIAKEICDSSRYKLVNLAERPITLGELKSLFSIADLVISNDTGPRHIAIALRSKLITLFGPNDPTWTDTGYEDEIKIVGDAPCAPCTRPRCEKSEHLCMKAITLAMVCSAAKELIGQKQTTFVHKQRFVEVSKSLFIDADFERTFSELGLTSIDAVFSFGAGKNLAKDNLARHRSRVQLEIGKPAVTVFLKRYDRPSIPEQVKNWLSHRSRKSFGHLEFEPAKVLAAAGINTPKTIAYGEQWGILFEKRSFIITEKVPNAESLERKLPDCFSGPATAENSKLRRNFIAQLAAFIKEFHQTGCRHRDLYFSHIFYSDDGRFYLIDLTRVFKPSVFAERFRVKDIAQVYYSAPSKYFSRTDRLRFYFALAGRCKLTREDKIFIRRVVNKANRMARHDVRHGRIVPFMS